MGVGSCNVKLYYFKTLGVSATPKPRSPAGASLSETNFRRLRPAKTEHIHGITNSAQSVPKLPCERGLCNGESKRHAARRKTLANLRLTRDWCGGIPLRTTEKPFSRQFASVRAYPPLNTQRTDTRVGAPAGSGVWGSRRPPRS